MNYIVIDQGTSSTKGFLFNSSGQILHRKRIKCVLKKPEKFHVESNVTYWWKENYSVSSSIYWSKDIRTIDLKLIVLRLVFCLS